jgi:hypothetical protein
VRAHLSDPRGQPRPMARSTRPYWRCWPSRLWVTWPTRPAARRAGCACRGTRGTNRPPLHEARATASPNVAHTCTRTRRQLRHRRDPDQPATNRGCRGLGRGSRTIPRGMRTVLRPCLSDCLDHGHGTRAAAPSLTWDQGAEMAQHTEGRSGPLPSINRSACQVIARLRRRWQERTPCGCCTRPGRWRAG